ncbi:MAG: ATP-binding protein [Chloroflexota bacterium]
MNRQINPLEEIANEWFVNRKEDLDYFWTWANRIPLPGRHSTAFAGLRRTGKTAIIHRVFNRLFHEQDRVTPVFISFEKYLHRPETITTYEFAEDYFGGYVRSYLAFRYGRPEFHRHELRIPDARDFAETVQDEFALEIIDSYYRGLEGREHLRSSGLSYWAINVPKGYGATHDIPAAIFIDEFQLLTGCYDPDDGIFKDLTNAFQKASETVWAPLVVSGSSVNLLMGQATGGALSGRLRYKILGPLEQQHALDMILRLGEFENIQITEEFALAIWTLTKGYPYAIESLMQTTSPAKELYPNPMALDEVLQFELTNINGLLFKHYNEEFAKYSTLLNDGQTTKRVMFWATKYPDERIDTERVAKEIGVEQADVQESLQKLEQLDIVTRHTWSVYHGPTDPMLTRYIAYQHAYEIENLTENQAAENLEQQIRRERGAQSHLVGQMAEVIVGAVMRGFDERTLDGETYFSFPEPVFVPKFTQIDQRWGVVEDGVPNELDLLGEYPCLTNIELPEDAPIEEQTAAWLVQVKYKKRTTSEDDVAAFLKQVESIRATKGYDQVTLWYVSKGGYTKDAESLLRTSNIYFSTLEQFNALAQQFDFLGLPA